MSNKLHELLAVEGDLDGIFKKITQETLVTFTKKESYFLGRIKELKLFNAEAEVTAPEVQAMVTTVPERLYYQAKHIIRFLDAVLQKEATNQIAAAPLVVDSVTISESVPATFLLGMESKLKHIRAIYDAIPTLAPQTDWVKDPDKGKGVYKDKNPDETFKSIKVTEPVVLYEATKEHPAQVKEGVKTVDVGKYKTQNWSGMLTSARKAQLIERIDKLLRAVKKARQKANRAEVVKGNIGKAMFEYIHAK